MSRSCDGCTKCCEGYLQGEAEGKKFYPGNPCHFVIIGKGCSIYAKRPKDPCINYQCLWKTSEEIPVWMKPSEINAIMDIRLTNSKIEYLHVHEAGAKLDASVLTWLVQYALRTGKNLLWEIGGGKHYIGSPEFVADISGESIKK